MNVSAGPGNGVLYGRKSVRSKSDKSKYRRKEILHGVDLSVGAGEVHVLMGPNGAGKSTLGNVLMGNPRYQITGGQILFKGEDITHESTDKRSKAGMFLSFQEPLEVPGLSLESFLRSAMRQQTGKNLKIWEFHKQLKRRWTFSRWMNRMHREA